MNFIQKIFVLVVFVTPFITHANTITEKNSNIEVAIKKAMEYPTTRKGAKGWVSFIKDTAARKKVSL